MGHRNDKGVIALKILMAMLFGSAFLWQCAKVGAPQGGPRDTLPPVVMSATPAFNTVNFTGTRIFVGFDEYVQLKDLYKELFVSPPMRKNPVVNVRGRGIQIDIKDDSLLENTTYAINLGSAIVDNNEGNPLNGFRFVFSTGPYIDSLIMSGYTVDAYKKDSVSRTLIYFFDAAIDTVPQYDSLLFKATPSAIARAENNGIFIARNLQPKDYKIYAYYDDNNNFIYDPGIDKVGFLDGTFNPTSLPGFDAWFDTTRMYMTAEPQVYLRLFMDKQFRRQNLAEKKRPQQHRIELLFNAPFPQIDSLTLYGIAPSRIITEYVTRGRDTINLWLNVPGEELPDTIKGRITYMRHDSINQLQPYTDSLRLVWKYIESKEEKREREKLEKERQRALDRGEEFEEPKKPNPFKYNTNASGELNPEHNVTFEFDYPVVEIDTTRISLVRLGEEDQVFRVRYGLAQDTVNIRKWVMSAAWAEGQKYRIEMPDSVILNVAGHRNDSIKREFTILSPDKFGTLTVTVKGKSDTSRYVLQLMDANNKLLQERRDAMSGVHVFRFISPGDVKLRVIEDMNGNGIWDPGDLVNRIQPERVEIYFPESGSELLTMKVNWDIEVTVDMNDLFGPIDIFEIRRQITRQEQARYQKWLEERAKRAEQMRTGQRPSSGGMGIGGAVQSATGAVR